MGLNASWMGVQTDDVPAVLERLGLMETGAIDFDLSADLVCTRVSDWVVLFGQDFDLFPKAKLAVLPSGVQAVACQASESAMVSQAFGFDGAQQAWSVSHDPEKGSRHLDVSGLPPLALESILERLRAEEAADDEGSVDYTFEVPLELTRAVCGFRPDGETPLAPETVFRIVEPLETGRGAARQSESRKLNLALNAAVEAELFASAATVGFEPLLDHPKFHRFSPFGVMTSFLRRQGNESQLIDFSWGFDEAPWIGITFFVYHGTAPRYGMRGWASTVRRSASFFDRLLRRKPHPIADLDVIDSVIAQAKDLLLEVDRHLTTGAINPRIHPAVYRD